MERNRRDDLSRLQRLIALLQGVQQHEGVDEDDEFIPDDDDDEEGDNESAEDDDVVWVSANRSVERVNDQATSAEQSRFTSQREEQAAALLNSRIASEMYSQTGCAWSRPNKRVSDMISKRELDGKLSPQKQVHVTQRFIPIHSVKRVAEYAHQAFCGQFSADGSMFMSAAQDCRVRLYDTCTWKLRKEILARDVGWSIIDTDYSPDGRWLIYSSWSDYVHLCNIAGEEERHEPLDMKPNAERFCLFSVSFSPVTDSRELIGGSSDRSLYIYDLDRRERTLRLEAHADDINSVAFADEGAQLILTGSDDCLIKVWDRRLLRASGVSSSQRGCVGVLGGHTEGITHIDARGDGRHLISNGKDQVIKLWDLRAMTDSSSGAQPMPRRSGFDYRYGGRLRSGITGLKDQSLMSYRGHRVFQTLIRCYFSPAFSTGQRYIYSGSYDGCIYIYDVLNGALLSRVCGHRATVRDVSWHPTDSLLLSTSWDGSVGMFNEKPKEKPSDCPSRRCP